MRERRQTARVSVQAAAEVVTRERTDRVVVRDLSRDGALVSGRYDVGDRILLRFDDDLVAGEVVRVSLDEDLRRVAGIRFDPRAS